MKKSTNNRKYKNQLMYRSNYYNSDNYNNSKERYEVYNFDQQFQEFYSS